jgi:hypothetical protein
MYIGETSDTRADGETADEARGEEARKSPGDGRCDRGQRKQQCNPQQHVAAAVAIAQAAGNGGSESRSRTAAS